MALNPPLNPQTNEPYRVENEYFVLKRKGVEFEMVVDKGNKYTGKGTVILTTARLVCINYDSKKFFAFDIPHALLIKEEFKQPIFGSNYIKGTVKPLLNLLPGNITFKIWFTQGGCGTFVPAYLNLVYSIRKNNNRGPDNKLYNSITSGSFAKTAFVDPNDPSTIFLEQPEAQYDPYQRNINNPYYPTEIPINNTTTVIRNPDNIPSNFIGNNNNNVPQNNMPYPTFNDVIPQPQVNTIPINNNVPTVNPYPNMMVNVAYYHYYPTQDYPMGNISNINVNNNQGTTKYFGIFGPELTKKN